MQQHVMTNNRTAENYDAATQYNAHRETEYKMMLDMHYHSIICNFRIFKKTEAGQCS